MPLDLIPIILMRLSLVEIMVLQQDTFCFHTR